MKRPIEALRSSDLFESGCGYLVVSRFKADGRVETGFFLIDAFCLGVKDADFCEFSDYADLQENLLAPLFRDQEPAHLSAAAARKLAEDAVTYAKGLGFSPAADYKKACRVFGGVSTADCQERFVFGKDGKPFYVQGPNEPLASRERILRVLEASCGEGGYHYIVAAADFDSDDEADELEEANILPSDWESGPGGTAAVRAMAARMRAEDPRLEVFVNPPGRRRVSDMISLVAQPLLEETKDFARKKMILNFAALAWNFRLLPQSEQRELLDNVDELFAESPAGFVTFAFLVARAMTLFPDEGRSILKIETEPAAFGDIGVRVASAM